MCCTLALGVWLLTLCAVLCCAALRCTVLCCYTPGSITWPATTQAAKSAFLVSWLLIKSGVGGGRCGAQREGRCGEQSGRLLRGAREEGGVTRPAARGGLGGWAAGVKGMPADVLRMSHTHTHMHALTHTHTCIPADPPIHSLPDDLVVTVSQVILWSHLTLASYSTPMCHGQLSTTSTRK